MELSLLNKLLKNEVSISGFRSNIQKEIAEYKKKIKTKGASISINIDEDSNLYFGKNDLLNLCNFYLHNRLSSIEIAYIADCLTLSNSVFFESSELLEFLEEITDPEINGEITKKRIMSIIDQI